MVPILTRPRPPQRLRPLLLTRLLPPTSRPAYPSSLLPIASAYLADNRSPRRSLAPHQILEFYTTPSRRRPRAGAWWGAAGRRACPAGKMGAGGGRGLKPGRGVRGGAAQPAGRLDRTQARCRDGGVMVVIGRKARPERFWDTFGLGRSAGRLWSGGGSQLWQGKRRDEGRGPLARPPPRSYPAKSAKPLATRITLQ